MTTPIPDWENPQITGINKEPAHATLIPYADAESAEGEASSGLPPANPKADQ